MKWYINKSKPICPQICEHMCVAINLGEFLPNQKIYSVRELSLLIGVTPNTVQKAYDMLFEMNIIYSVPGAGWFVCENTNTCANRVEALVNEKIEEYFNNMESIGFSKEKATLLLQERVGKTNEWIIKMC